MKRIAIFLSFVMATGALPAPASSGPRAGGARPNVLLIVVDDLRTSLGCYGVAQAHTPNIDGLASRGVLFEQVFTQYPLCNGARTSLLSGRRPDTTRTTSNNTSPRVALRDAEFLPDLFRHNGYFTAQVGKVAHAGFERDIVWDVSLRNVLWTGDPRDYAGRGYGASPLPDAEQLDGQIARDAVGLIRERRNKPFLIAVGFNKPHRPLVAPRQYFDRVPPSSVTVPYVPPDDLEDIPPAALPSRLGSRVKPKQERANIAAYLACVAFVDAQVGLVLDALADEGLAESTIVVFVSDHGYLLGEHRIWRKKNLFDPALRVPLIVAGPGVPEGRRVTRLVESVDLYPTLADLCGLSAPADLEGLSFAPLLTEPDREWKQGAFSQLVMQDGTRRMARTVRTERYRYTEWGDPRVAELYDHGSDPDEFTNRAGDPAYEEVKAQLRALLRAGWRGALPRRAQLRE